MSWAPIQKWWAQFGSVLAVTLFLSVLEAVSGGDALGWGVKEWVVYLSAVAVPLVATWLKRDRVVDAGREVLGRE